MKIITHIQGLSFLRYSAEDVAPASGIVPNALAQSLTATYRFTEIVPMPQQQMSLIPSLTFQSGEFSEKDVGAPFPIIQLGLGGGGAFVTTTMTGNSDIVLSHLMSLLKKSFGFRFGDLDQAKRIYSSSLVIQFEKQISEYIEKISKMEGVINAAMHADEKPFFLKRFNFGREGRTPPIITPGTIQRSDFIMERREGRPYSENRWFCSAPMETQAHIKVLEEIERAMA